MWEWNLPLASSSCERFPQRELYLSNVRDLVRDPGLATSRTKANVNGSAIGHGNGDNGSPSIGALSPKVGNLSIIGTSPTSITLKAYVNVTNPTNYSATVPYFNINILVNGTILGQATAKDVSIHPGNNTNIVVTAIWDPFTNSGAKGKAIGKELLSQYVSSE